jgi:pilus assembly protein Flp/PilA
LQAFVNASVGNPDCSQPEKEMGPEMLELIRRINRCEQGATAVEYGLIIAMIVIAIVGSLGNFGQGSQSMWNKVSNKVIEVSN